jgi:Na+-transporting methylmalonyl-CoA/oxaloacetate decarboxylase gamma subunit
MIETTGISEGIVALILGMSTVFLILILISIVISLFQHFNFDNGIKLKSRKTNKDTEELVELGKNNEQA